jgi:[acyl-carrier-protein] S-malonyltransferase
MTISLPAGAVPGPVSEEYDWDAELSAALAGELPEWRLVVAPQRGIFHAAGAEDSQSGTVVGHIEARRDRQAIVAPWRGAIIEWLVQDGDPVALGQPVARLLPDDASDGAE